MANVSTSLLTDAARSAINQNTANLVAAVLAHVNEDYWAHTGVNLVKVPFPIPASQTIQNVAQTIPGTVILRLPLTLGTTTGAYLVPALPLGPAPASAATQAPVFTVNPETQTVAANQTVTITVAATGSAPLFLQWRFNGQIMEGETGANLVITDFQAANAGVYDCVATNTAGQAFSTQATVSIGTSPSGVPPLTSVVTAASLEDLNQGCSVLSNALADHASDITLYLAHGINVVASVYHNAYGDTIAFAVARFGLGQAPDKIIIYVPAVPDDGSVYKTTVGPRAPDSPIVYNSGSSGASAAPGVPVQDRVLIMDYGLDDLQNAQIYLGLLEAHNNGVVGDVDGASVHGGAYFLAQNSLSGNGYLAGHNVVVLSINGTLYGLIGDTSITGPAIAPRIIAENKTDRFVNGTSWDPFPIGPGQPKLQVTGQGPFTYQWQYTFGNGATAVWQNLGAEIAVATTGVATSVTGSTTCPGGGGGSSGPGIIEDIITGGVSAIFGGPTYETGGDVLSWKTTCTDDTTAVGSPQNLYCMYMTSDRATCGSGNGIPPNSIALRCVISGIGGSCISKTWWAGGQGW